MKKKISIVIPTLNEEVTIKEFIDKCNIGIQKLKENYDSEILILDSSNDKTSEIIKKTNAKLIEVKKKGLGNAYIESLNHITGDIVIMGDADLTYDFTKIDQFVKKIEEGFDFVVGNRFKGLIEKDAMPKHHQYFGSPITSFIFNVIYKTPVKDIHCGMRALTTKKFKEMNIISQSWQYASEMIIKARIKKFKIAEIPINFYKDKENRVSNLKRQGFLAPWYAGWISILEMFRYSLFFFSGKLSSLFSLSLLLLNFINAIHGPLKIGFFTISLHWMFLSFILQIFFLILFMLNSTFKYLVYKEDDIVFKKLNYSVMLLIVSIPFCIILNLPLLNEYLNSDMRLSSETFSNSYSAVVGLQLFINCYIYFVFSILNDFLKTNYDNKNY